MCCCHDYPVASSVATFSHLEGYVVEEERESKAMTVELLMYIHLPWMAKGDNIQCKTWSAKCDCQSSFILVLEDFKLL